MAARNPEMTTEAEQVEHIPAIPDELSKTAEIIIDYHLPIYEDLDANDPQIIQNIKNETDQYYQKNDATTLSQINNDLNYIAESYQKEINIVDPSKKTIVQLRFIEYLYSLKDKHIIAFEFLKDDMVELLSESIKQINEQYASDITHAKGRGKRRNVQFKHNKYLEQLSETIPFLFPLISSLLKEEPEYVVSTITEQINASLNSVVNEDNVVELYPQEQIQWYVRDRELDKKDALKIIRQCGCEYQASASSSHGKLLYNDLSIACTFKHKKNGAPRRNSAHLRQKFEFLGVPKIVYMDALYQRKNVKKA